MARDVGDNRTETGGRWRELEASHVEIMYAGGRRHLLGNASVFLASDNLTLAELWRRLPAWARAWLTALDIAINVRHGGRAGETLSERAVRDKLAGGLLGAAACEVLDRADRGHCDRIIAKLTRDAPPNEGQTHRSTGEKGIEKSNPL